jgi:hypothetical protein
VLPGWPTIYTLILSNDNASVCRTVRLSALKIRAQSGLAKAERSNCHLALSGFPRTAIRAALPCYLRRYQIRSTPASSPITMLGWKTKEMLESTKRSRARRLNPNQWRNPGQTTAPWTTPQRRSSTPLVQRRCHRIAGTAGTVEIAGTVRVGDTSSHSMIGSCSPS